MGRSLGAALQWGRERLRATPTETPALDGELLMGHATGLARARLLAHPDAPLSAAEDDAFSILIERRVRGEPVAYLVGQKAFYGLGLRVDRRVLIPRPETETLVERALELVPPREDGWVVADVGTGSGAIALAVAAHRPRARVYATDSSTDALDVARDNAARVLGDGWEQRVRFIRFTDGPLLADVPERVDVLCANLPYIPSAEMATLPVSVREHEPRSALDGGADGLDAYRALLEDAPQRLTARGAVLMECDPRQTDALLALALGALPGGRGEIVHDLAGDARVVEVRR